MGLTMILAALAGLSVVHLMYSTTYTNNLILIASVHTGTAVEPTELVHLTREEYNVKSSIKQNSSWLWGKRSKSMVNDLLKLANDVDKKLEDFNYAAELLNRSKGITTKILINLVTPATEKLRTSSAGGKGKIPREIIDQIGRHNMMKEKDQRSRLTDIANDLELVRRTMQLTIPSKWRQKPDVLKYLPTLKPKRQKNLSKLNNITHASILSGAQVLTSESSVPENVENQSIYGEPGCPDNPDRTVLTIIFQKWIETAKRVNVTYFLSCGTLLGSYRNYDVIPYDTDIDILIDRRDFEKIKSISGRRNFREKDNKFHLVVQEDFYLPYSQRRRFTCKGKVSMITFLRDAFKVAPNVFCQNVISVIM